METAQCINCFLCKDEDQSSDPKNFIMQYTFVFSVRLGMEKGESPETLEQIAWPETLTQKEVGTQGQTPSF